MEDYAWVIEYLPLGHAAAIKKEPMVQLLGTQFYTLLEATINPEASIVLGKKVCVGKEGREEVEHIKGRISFEQLTTGAKDFLPSMLRKAIEGKEEHFIKFINNARPMSMRIHTLDLLPGIGKKTMETLLKEREVKPFESFEDLKTRVPSLADPVGIFVTRIESELQGKEKYHIFTKPPFQKGGPDRRRRRY
jgi:putative nucleotide binding protein